MDAIKFVENDLVQSDINTDFKAGDTVSVSYKIREGNKERIQVYQGVVLQRRGKGIHETFTVRKISGGMGVERVFPVKSPFIESVTVSKRGAVRRARIFYLRDLRGKSARIKEKMFAGGTKKKKK